MAFSEKNTVQQWFIDQLSTKGEHRWEHIEAKNLDRSLGEPWVESHLRQSLTRLNPSLAKDSSRVDETIYHIQSVINSAHNQGVMAANKQFIQDYALGFTYHFAGDDDPTDIRIFDLIDLSRNDYVISDEVIYDNGVRNRFDIVLWINGLPVVVLETKAVNEAWQKGAQDIEDVYVAKAGEFFVTNILNVASNLREFRYASVGAPLEHWNVWGSTSDPYDLSGQIRTRRSTELLLSPNTLLSILEHFTLFQAGSAGRVLKVIPRYVQVEAAEAIHERVRDPEGGNGLVHHYQGTGKTLLMVFTARKMLQDTSLENPTIVIVLDRTDLQKNAYDDFIGSDVSSVYVAKSSDDLEQHIRNRSHDVIITIINKFQNVDLTTKKAWNDSNNVVVMVDEAHRTQDGDLGSKMRRALPNARYFGMTGTPVNDANRDTFALFGNEKDPGKVLSKYTMERAIHDGISVPIYVEPRLVEWKLDETALEQAFDDLMDEHNLDEDAKEYITERSSRPKAIMMNPDRIEKVCTDIVNHFHEHVAPKGFKAQVVAFDREVVVAYEKKINDILKKKGHTYTTQVVMTAGDKEDIARGWEEYDLSGHQESVIIDNFRKHDHAPDILIVTSKLLTGFNAPIEQVMYFDKPLSRQALFQAITRTNRRYSNPVTGEDKSYGIIVDYVGVARNISEALKEDSPEAQHREVAVDEVLGKFEKAMKVALKRFQGLDRTDDSGDAFIAATNKLANQDDVREFSKEFMTVHGLWEALAPNPRLEKYRDDYRWLATIYDAMRKHPEDYSMLWENIGAKTIDLINEHISEVKLSKQQKLKVSSDTIEQLSQLSFILGAVDEFTGDSDLVITADEVLDSIEARIKRSMSESDKPSVYASLGERLEALRQRSIETIEQTKDFLERAIELARQVRAIDAQQEQDKEIPLEDKNVGALSQIVAEYSPDVTPMIVENVATDIDKLARDATFSGWNVPNSEGNRKVRLKIRKLLARYKLPIEGDLFDAVYGYIADHYD